MKTTLQRAAAAVIFTLGCNSTPAPGAPAPVTPTVDAGAVTPRSTEITPTPPSKALASRDSASSSIVAGRIHASVATSKRSPVRGAR